MAANGISTLVSKAARKAAKIALAEAKRQDPASSGYRELNVYAGTVSPAEGRPWTTGIAPGEEFFVDENGDRWVDENNNNIIG